MNITPKDTIGYLRRFIIDGKTQFRWIEAKVKRVVIGKTKTSVYSDKFCVLDFDEIESNTRIMMSSKGLIVVDSPFITTPELTEKYKNAVDYWNKHGAQGLFD